MYLPLVEFMYSIPWDVKFCPSSDRTIHRAAFADILPVVVARRDTKTGPDQATYAGLEAGSEWVRFLTERPLLAARGYVDMDRWSHAVELARIGRCASIKLFVATATLEVWLRQLEAPISH